MRFPLPAFPGRVVFLMAVLALVLGVAPAWVPPAHAAPGKKPPSPAPGEAHRADPPPLPQPERLAAPPGSRHHLFLYVFDGLAATEMPAYGYARMTVPRLTDLMEEGFTFTSVYSVSPWTVPAVTSLLTSLYPSAHTVQRAGDRLPASANTLAEILKNRGYDTALFSAHPLVGPLSGLGQGFDWHEEIPGPFGPAPPDAPAETSATLNRKILAWLDGRKSKAPTFVLAVSGDPLEPFGAPPPAGRRFIGDGEYKWYAEVRRKLLQVRPGNLSLATKGDLQRLHADPERFARDARDVYDGAVLYNDTQLGLLRSQLEKRGYWKNALFVVTSSHGQEFGERGAFGSGATLYDTAVEVPLVMSYPAVASSPRQMRRTCDTVDLLPTLLSLLGFPVPEGVQGIERNVEPTPATRRQYTRAAFAETSPAGELPTGRASMISDEGVKLIVHEELPAGFDLPEMEFFRPHDPAGWEKRSTLMQAPARAAKKREVLDGWRRVKGKPQLSPDEGAASPDPRLGEILRSLGYLAGMEPPKPVKP